MKFLASTRAIARIIAALDRSTTETDVAERRTPWCGPGVGWEANDASLEVHLELAYTGIMVLVLAVWDGPGSGHIIKSCVTYVRS